MIDPNRSIFPPSIVRVNFGFWSLIYSCMRHTKNLHYTSRGKLKFRESYYACNYYHSFLIPSLSLYCYFPLQICYSSTTSLPNRHSPQLGLPPTATLFNYYSPQPLLSSTATPLKNNSPPFQTHTAIVSLPPSSPIPF